MKLPEVTHLLERLERDFEHVYKKTGGTSQWIADMPDGSRLKYITNGIPDLIRMRDHIATTIENLWKLKDHLAEELIERGMELKPAYKLTDDFVDAHEPLRLVADLANKEKHARLRKKQRSNKGPNLGRVKIEAHQKIVDGRVVDSAFTRIIRRVGEVQIDFADKPELIDLTIPVLDRNGAAIADGFELIGDAYYEWSAFMHQHKLEWPGPAPP